MDAGVIVTGPPGYCVDLDASQERKNNAFVLLASCAAISNEPLMPQPSSPAILTAAIAQGNPTTTDALDRYFRSAKGAAALGGGGSIDTMRLKTDEGALFVLTNGSGGAQWRGLVPLDQGFLVTISLQEIGNTPMSPDDRLAELGLFARRIVRANPGLATP